MYCDGVIEYFGEGEGPPVQDYNPTAYEDWAKKYEVERNDAIEAFENFKPDEDSSDEMDDSTS